MNNRQIINKNNLKCEVLAIGVPLMIYANSFIYSALKKENIDYNELLKDKINNKNISKLIKVLDSQQSNLIVASTNIKEIVELYSDIIYKSIIKFLIKI